LELKRAAASASIDDLVSQTRCCASASAFTRVFDAPWAVHRRAGIENRENNPMQSRMGLGASVADTLFWPRRDHRRFLLPRPGIQDEPRDFACRIPDESDPGVIFVV